MKAGWKQARMGAAVEVPGVCLQLCWLMWLPVGGNRPRQNWWGSLGAEHPTPAWLKELGPGQTPSVAFSSDTSVLTNSHSVPDLLLFSLSSCGAQRGIVLLSIYETGLINTGPF